MQATIRFYFLAVISFFVVESLKINDDEVTMATLTENLDQSQNCESCLRRHNKDLDDSIQQCPVILSNTEIKNVTNVTNVNQTKCYQNGVEKSCFDSECPTLSEKYLESKLYLKDTSLSPWKWIVNYDENRDPQCLAEAKCLCNGCVDPFSRTENLDLRSVPITIDRHVKIKRNGKYVDDVVTLNMGCRCDFRISS